jgi:hypothetical protein
VFLVVGAGVGIGGVGANAGPGAAAPLGCVVARDLLHDWQNVESSGSVVPQKRQNIVRPPFEYRNSSPGWRNRHGENL